MATAAQLDFLKTVYVAAKEAGHIFPEAAACEACVETAWGASRLCVEYLNLFSMKQHTHPVYGTVNLPTCEFLNRKWVKESDDFVVYPSLAACFGDRMNTLQMLARKYSHYAAALAAHTPEEFLTQVSMTWATSATRAESCIEILHAHDEMFV